MRRILLVATAAAAYAVSCHLAAGLDDLEVSEDLIADVCERYCEIDTEIGCSGLVCGEDICRAVLQVDAYPWCEEEILKVNVCAAEVGAVAFECVGDAITALRLGFCETEWNAYVACLWDGDYPDTTADCNAACGNAFSNLWGVCGVPDKTCVGFCIESTVQTATCSGAFAGYFHCAMLHPEDWRCQEGFPVPDDALHSCFLVWNTLYTCQRTAADPQPTG